MPEKRFPPFLERNIARESERERERDQTLMRMRGTEEGEALLEGGEGNQELRVTAMVEEDDVGPKVGTDCLTPISVEF